MINRDETSGQQKYLATILVVDDQDDLLDLMALFLRVAGYRVLTSSSGANALSCCRNLAEPIDLALLDFNLPDMTGLNLLLALNELLPGLRHVFMTGNASALDTFLSEGHVWIYKPFEFDRLLEFVKTQIESNSAGESR